MRLLSHIAAFFLSPIAALWARHHEKRILQQGRPLTEKELQACQLLGIDHSEQLRLVEEKELAFPAPQWLVSLIKKCGIPIASAAAMCLRHGIFVQKDQGDKHELVYHELVHTRQYQQIGSLTKFMRRYLFECLHFGYHDAPMEQEARDEALRIERELG